MHIRMMDRGFIVPENTYNYPTQTIKHLPLQQSQLCHHFNPSNTSNICCKFLEMKSEVWKWQKFSWNFFLFKNLVLWLKHTDLKIVVRTQTSNTFLYNLNFHTITLQTSVNSYIIRWAREISLSVSRLSHCTVLIFSPSPLLYYVQFLC